MAHVHPTRQNGESTAQTHHPIPERVHRVLLDILAEISRPNYDGRFVIEGVVTQGGIRDCQGKATRHV